MVESTFLKVISVIKSLAGFLLFSAFLFMTIKALIDLFSGRTNFVTSTDHRKVTYLPAFSVCKNVGQHKDGFDKTDLADGLMRIEEQPFTLGLTLTLVFENGNSRTGGTHFNVKERDAKFRSHIKNPKEDLWTLQCKVFWKGSSHCMPCITFNGAHFKTQGIEKARVRITFLFR